MILHTLSSLWTSVAPGMADHLWQSTVFVVLAAMLAFALRRNQARIRYGVWLAASLKFVIPFSLLIAFGSHLARPRTSASAQTAVYSAVEDFSQPFAGQETLAVPQTLPSPSPVNPFHLFPPVIVAVWLGGAVVVLLVWTTSWIRVSRTMRRAAVLSEGPEVEALRRMEARLGVRKPIRLVLSQNWMEPGIFGVFRPVLIWPEGISPHLNDRHIDAILAHEIHHARRHDNLTAALHMLVEAVFWFHPLVWWVGRRLEEERERACDEEVGLLCRQPQVYAESILRVCKFCSESPLACVSGITGADLKKRIVQIMTERVASRLDFGRKLLLVAVGLAMVAVPVVLGQAKAEQRLILAAIHAAPKPVQTAARAMMAEEEALSSGEIADAAQIQDSTQDVTAQPPKFEAVSIRPCEDPRIRQVPGDTYPPRGTSTPGRLRTGCYPLLDDNGMGLIRGAYADTFTPINGGPSWMHSAFYEIDAIAEGNPSVKMMMGPMMQRLLEERFHLKIHHQAGEGPVYLLDVARGGPKLHPFVEGSCTLHSTFPAPALPSGQEYCESLMGAGSPASVNDRGTTLDYFSSQLRGVLDRPVINRTNIAGRFDIHLNFSREGTKFAGMSLAPSMGGNSPASDPTGPLSIFTALEEQLGLKLVPSKGPVPVLVIDHIEKPTVDGAEVAPAASATPVAQEPSASDRIAHEKPMAANADPAFEVATIKPAKPDEPKRIRYPGHFAADSMDVNDLIAFAYGLHSKQIVGAPDWFGTKLFDVEGKSDVEGLPSQHQLSLMVQKLLRDRFALRFHREQRELSVYIITVGPGGPKMDRTKSQPEDDQGFGFRGLGDLVVTNMNMAEFASWMQSAIMAKPVVDHTGLTDRYDFHLKWTPDDSQFAQFRGTKALAQPPAGDNPDAPPSLYTAMPEQLGLKMEAGKTMDDVIVIDHAEPPSPN